MSQVVLQASLLPKKEGLDRSFDIFRFLLVKQISLLESDDDQDRFTASRIPLPWKYVDRAWWALPASNWIKISHVLTKWTEVTPLSPFLSPNGHLHRTIEYLKATPLGKRRTGEHPTFRDPSSPLLDCLLTWVPAMVRSRLVGLHCATSYKED